MSQAATERALSALAHSRALWNRTRLEIESDEVLAQILDRGTMVDWRALYQLARNDATLRARMLSIIKHVPLPLPRFWLAALASLGEVVDFQAELPSYGDAGT